MLYTGVNQFNWQVNNFGDQFPGSASATTLTADAVANTKGADTALLSGLAYDCWGIYIMVSVGSTDVTIRRQMIDLLVDPAAGVGNAGSSWSVAINNLYCNSPTAGAGGTIGCNFYFPLFLPAGTAIGARTQDVVGGATCRFSIRILGQPSRPDLTKVGHVVQTIGATTATTSGVAVTPGDTTIGTYSASLGTLTRDAWWWQLGHGSADTSFVSNNLTRWDVAWDATAKYIAIRSILTGGTGSEQMSKTWCGEGLPISHAPAGTDVYVRGTGVQTPDGSQTVVVYALT